MNGKVTVHDVHKQNSRVPRRMWNIRRVEG